MLYGIRPDHVSPKLLEILIVSKLKQACDWLFICFFSKLKLSKIVLCGTEDLMLYKNSVKVWFQQFEECQINTSMVLFLP